MGAQDGLEDRNDLRNIKAFLDSILLIFHAQETCKSTTTHNPGPYPRSLAYPYPPLTARFSSQRRFFNRQKQRMMLLTTLSAGAIVHSALLTKFAVTGHYQVCTGNLRKKITTQQSTWMKMAVAQRHWEVVLGAG